MGAFVVSAQTIKGFKQKSSNWFFCGPAFSTRLPLSPDARWCHGSLLACKRASTMPQLFWFPHLSQDMFITYRSRPKINVGTKHPGWVMNPPASSSAVSDRRVDFLSFPPSVALLCPSHFHGSVLYFFLRNISQQSCEQ